MSELLGRFMWYELMTSDPKAAEAFYTKVIGWGTVPFEGAGTPYTMWTRGQTPVGGVMQLPEEARKAGSPPHWLMYVGTPDVDATAKQVQELGGKVFVEPQNIPNVGRFSVVSDPYGAVFAIYMPAQAPAQEESAPQPGDFSWHELATTDNEAAFKFYATLFGWGETQAMDMGPGGIYRIFGRKGRDWGGVYNKPANMPAPPHWLLYARVPNVHETAKIVAEHGGKILNGPMEVPGGDFIAQCMDPQGAAFAIHHSATASASAGA